MSSTFVSDEALIDRGFVPNSFLLDLNHSLQTPDINALPLPWSLPSRLFRFPIEIGCRREDGTRLVGLMHPLIWGHPFVCLVAAELGVDPAVTGAPNDSGVSKQGLARWWHAVDLVSSGRWRDLLKTRQFTTDECVAGAVTFGLDFSKTDRLPHLTPVEAREILRQIGKEAPPDRCLAMHTVSAPSPVCQDNGRIRWPINTAPRFDAGSVAWGRLLGIEAGWFNYDQSGYLQWTDIGRDRYAAGDGAASYAEAKTGQYAFGF